MTCGSSREILLDMARGAAVPEPARRTAAAHIESCGACAAEFTRQQRLTVGLQALAAEAQTWVPPASAEERLLTALSTAASTRRPRVSQPAAFRARRTMYGLAAAAVVVLGVWFGVRATRDAGRRLPVAPETTTAHTSPATPAPPRDPATRDSTGPDAATPRPPHGVQGRSTPRRGTNPGPANRQPASTWEFTRLPGAIGLPEMESGSVVRMELPIEVLPEYGLDIVPDAARTSIEADVLVGQDGQPRAIRLVSASDTVAQDSRSRR
jgi:hypothetical protein